MASNADDGHGTAGDAFSARNAARHGAIVNADRGSGAVALRPLLSQPGRHSKAMGVDAAPPMVTASSSAVVDRPVQHANGDHHGPQRERSDFEGLAPAPRDTTDTGGENPGSLSAVAASSARHCASSVLI